MFNKIECINENHSTTRLCYKLLDDKYLDENGKIKEEYKFSINIPKLKIQNSKFIGKPEDKFETTLFLPEGEGRKGEGGLRTKGYFKFSYVWCGDSECDSDGACVGDSGNGSKGRWWIADLDGNPIMPAPEEIQKQISQYINSLSSNTQSSGAVDTNSTSQTNLRVNCDGDGNISTFKDHNSPFTNHDSLLNKLPLITVITVVFNGEKYLEQTIQSVINQTYPNVEYIIIDGGSTDGTLDIIKQYEDYIDYWVSERDKGIYDAMNKGIRVALGKWINFMNGGDRLIFLDLNSLLKLNTSNTSYYYHEQQHKIKRDPFTKMYLTHNTPCHQSIFYKKNEIVPFDLNFPIIADFEQMTKICTKNIRPVFSEHVVYFAKAGLSYENNHDKSWSKLWSRVKIVYKNIGVSYGIVSSVHMFRIFFKNWLK